MTTAILPALIQQFFTDRLCTQMEASPNTIAGYRDTFRLLLRFASEQTGRAPTKLNIEDLDSALVGDFLAHVETQRSNSARSRNTRLAAIRSFFRFVAMNEPDYMLHSQRILAMPGKRYVRRTVEFLDRAEMDALLAAPDRSTWVGRRDYVILILALQTGLRASELINLRRCDVVTGTGAHIRCEGKGRKQVSPHVLRHSTAMELLHHGVDQSVIALWLGHESLETTQVYMHADLRLKEKALARITAPASNPGRYRPDDKLLVCRTAAPECPDLHGTPHPARHNPSIGIMRLMPISA
jgi:site-specific recombinase XerD